METKLLKPAEIASVLRCHVKTVLKKMRIGQLPKTEIAGMIYMTEAQLEKVIRAGEKRKFERAC